MQLKGNASTLFSKKATQNVTQNTTIAPKLTNATKAVEGGKNKSQSKKEFMSNIKQGQMVLKNNQTSGNIDLVQKNNTVQKSAQNVTSIVQVKLNATKPVPVLKSANVTNIANKTKKASKKKHVSAPI